MSDTPRQYVIREGDTLLRIALMFGVEVDQIVHFDKNQDLFVSFPGNDESTPGDLLPIGETLFVPPPPPLKLLVVPKKPNRFEAAVPVHGISIAFEDTRGPLANAPYRLEGLPPEVAKGLPERPKLDASGKLRLDLPAYVDHFRIVFDERSVVHPIWVGHLAHSAQEQGIQQRLAHLGYAGAGPAVPAAQPSAGAPTTIVSPASPMIPAGIVAPVGPADSSPDRPGDPGTFRDLDAQQGAIAAFQQGVGLEPTGYADEETRLKLVKRHGA